MQGLEVNVAVGPIYGSLGVKRLIFKTETFPLLFLHRINLHDDY